MSYQVIYRDVSDGVFVSLRQTGYASIQIRSSQDRSCTLFQAPIELHPLFRELRLT
jgi:hypothetical protein